VKPEPLCYLNSRSAYLTDSNSTTRDGLRSRPSQLGNAARPGGLCIMMSFQLPCSNPQSRPASPRSADREFPCSAPTVRVPFPPLAWPRPDHLSIHYVRSSLHAVGNDLARASRLTRGNPGGPRDPGDRGRSQPRPARIPSVRSARSDSARGRYQDVGRLDVAVDNEIAVGMRQGRKNIQQQANPLLDSQRPGLAKVIYTRASYILQYEIGSPRGRHPRIGESRDIRMRQSREQAPVDRGGRQPQTSQVGRGGF
jgi:hypothetical protein